MHTSRIDLNSTTRAASVNLLNATLANLIDLRLQAKQAHWNVKGPQFIALHELFDQVVDAVDDGVDEVAERAVILGGVAHGTLGCVSKATQLSTYPVDITRGVDHLHALATAIAATGKGVRTAIDEAAKLGDAGTSDLFTGLSQTLDKHLWLLEAHLQSER